MGRNRKMGLDYFPFDIDTFQDIRIRKLIKYQGGKAMTVYALLLCLIYKGGYYMMWDEELPFIISEQTGFEEAYISEVIKSCLALGLFSKELFEMEHVLSSKGIQERYRDICKQINRKCDFVEYSLISSEEKHISSEEIPISSEEMPINSEKIPQKKIKEKEKKEILSNESIKKKAASAATHERKEAFYHSLIPYADKYGKEMLRAFFDYWSEMNASQTKMRFEKQPTWELSKRLATWANNEKKYEKNRRAATGKTKQERVEEFAKAIATKLATGDTGNLQDGGESALPF